MKQIKRSVLLFISLLLMLCASSCSDKAGSGYINSDTVLECGEYDVTHDEYKYFYMNYKLGSDGLTESQLHQKAADAIKRDRAICELADEYDIELSDSEEDELDSYIEGFINEYGGEEAYLSHLAESYLTGDLFRYLSSQQKIEEKLREYMLSEVNNIIPSDDASFERDLENNFMAVKQILIRNDAEDSSADNARIAREIFARVNSGENFEALMKEYSEDEDSDPEYGRYFTRGMLLPEFEEAVLSIDENELYPEVLESSVGYHIILRIPMDEGYINDNYGTLRYYYQSRCFNEIVDEKAQSFEIVRKEDFNKLVLE